MAVLDGCQGGKGTPDVKEVKCPKCGAIIEVYVSKQDTTAGRLIEDAVCDKCGYVIKEGTPFDEIK